MVVVKVQQPNNALIKVLLRWLVMAVLTRQMIDVRYAMCTAQLRQLFSNLNSQVHCFSFQK